MWKDLILMRSGSDPEASLQALEALERGACQESKEKTVASREAMSEEITKARYL